MDNDTLRQILLKKSLEELHQMRGEQYTNREELVEDIIANDDGSVREAIQMEGSFLEILAKNL